MKDVLSELAGASPRRLLDDLSRLATALAKNDRARPEIELHLASGQTIRGRIVSVTDDRNAAIAVVHVGGTLQQPSVAFVRVDQINAVGVVDASLLVRASIADTPAPSKLELQRQIASRLDALHVKLKIELSKDLDDDGRRAVGVLLPVLFDVLAAITGDDMGKQALAQIDTIELAAASNAEVVKEARGFLVRAPKLVTEQLTHQALRRAFETHL